MEGVPDHGQAAGEVLRPLGQPAGDFLRGKPGAALDFLGVQPEGPLGLAPIDPDVCLAGLGPAGPAKIDVRRCKPRNSCANGWKPPDANRRRQRKNNPGCAWLGFSLTSADDGSEGH